MTNFKEIVTKAVIGKGKKNLIDSYVVETEEIPNTVLGCWVINHKFNGVKNGENILVSGNFDINIWYSYDNDTKTGVSTKKFNYQENLKVKINESSKLTDECDIIVRQLKQPAVTDVKIDNEAVKLNVEKELGIEVVGDTLVKVSIEDEMDDYEDIEDLDQVIDSEVTDDYI